MFDLRFALSRKKHLEKHLSSSDCMGSALLRSYMTKKLDRMIS